MRAPVKRPIRSAFAVVTDELLEKAKRLPPQARRELRDRLDRSLQDEPSSAAAQPKDGPYASLLSSAGSARSLGANVARNKNEHLADVYAPKRRGS